MKPEIFRQRCFIFTVLFSYFLLHYSAGKIILVLKPVNPFVYIGDNLELICNSSEPVADRLIFLRGDDKAIDPKYLQKLDDFTLQLNIPITEQDKNINQYMCRLGNTFNITSQHLRMEYKPRPVENVTCQIYNWKTLTCTWDLGPYIRLRDIYVTVCWKHSIVKWNCNVTVADDKSEFSMDYMFTSYNFNITVSHQQEGVEDVNISQIYERPQIKVKPATVKNLQVESERNQCVTLKFEHEMHDYNLTIRNLTIRVTYSSKWELQPLVVEKVLETENITVCSVHPYSNYKFDVDVLPVDNDGVWSDVKTVEYLTNSQVPGAGPISTNGSYYQGSCTDNRRRVTIFIQHVDESLTHGEIQSYTAVYNPVLSGEQLTSTQPSTSYTLDYILKCSTDYLVEVKATNDIGTSTNNTFVYIPKLSQNPVQSKATFLITVYRESNTSDKNIVANWSGFENQPLHYKLFWCQSSTFKCMGNINWIEVEGDVTSKILPSDLLKIEDVEARKYVFSISAIYKRNISTPVIFANCVYQSWAVPKDPPKLQLDEMNTVRSLIVSWQYETCHSQSLVYIQSYIIYHCPTDHRGNCTDEKTTEQVDSKINNYQLKDLKAATNYSVWMQPVSPGGLGPESEKLYGVPLEKYILSGGIIAGIVLGTLTGLAGLFLLIFRICCRNYWDSCCKKYTVTDFKSKEEGLKSSYANIDYYENDVEINGEERITQTVTPKLKTQISDDSGTFSLPHSPSVREHLPSISEAVAINPKITARSVSDVLIQKSNDENNQDQIQIKTVPASEFPSYCQVVKENGQFIFVGDSPTTINSNITESPNSVLSRNNTGSLEIPGNTTGQEANVFNRTTLREKPAINFVSMDLQSTEQSSVGKDSKSSSSASSNSPKSHSSSTDSDGVSPYSRFTQSQCQASNESDSHVELEPLNVIKGDKSALQSTQDNACSGSSKQAIRDVKDLSKVDSTCSDSNKLTTGYVDHANIDILLPSVHQNTNTALGESHS